MAIMNPFSQIIGFGSQKAKRNTQWKAPIVCIGLEKAVWIHNQSVLDQSSSIKLLNYFLSIEFNKSNNFPGQNLLANCSII